MQTSNWFRRNRLTLAMVAFGLWLPGCGGGGGTTPTPSVIPGNFIKTIPTNPFPAGSVSGKDFAEINRVRIAGGFGGIQHDPVMLAAAAAHDNYLKLNFGTAGIDPTNPPHGELAGFPGFTGVRPQERCAAAAKGTDGEGKMLCGEVGTGAIWDEPVFNTVGGFTEAIGHLQILLDWQSNRIGLNLQMYPDTSGGHYPTPYGGTVNVGARADSSFPTLDSDKVNSIVGIFPYDGMTGVGLGSGAVYPDGSVSGMGVMVQSSNPLVNPEVAKFTLRKDGATTDWPVTLLMGGQPNHNEPTVVGWAVLRPNVVLAPNAKYNVIFEGKVNSVAVSRTWSFNTGSRWYHQQVPQ